MQLIQELKRDNLCTYFVLPLLRLNKFSFTGSNFIDSYLTRDCSNIVVKVYDIALVRSTIFLHGSYKNHVIKDSFCYLIFSLPRQKRMDIARFIAGKFSAISNSSKELIYTWSGLPYKQVSSNGKAITDARLLALTRHKVLREAWIREYEVKLDASDELLEIPDKDLSFIDL